MRTRTVLGAVTSALLIGLWSAPAALAAEPPDDGGKAPPSNSAVPEPGAAASKVKEFKAAEPSASAAPSAEKSEPKIDDPKPVDPKPVQPKIIEPKIDDPKPVVPEPVDPKPVLTLNPGEVKPGAQFLATAVCAPGTGTLSAARDVSFSGLTGKVSDNAGPGDVEITLKCVNGDKSAQVSKTLKVAAKDDGPTILPIAPGEPNPGDKRARLSVPDQLYPGDRFRAFVYCPKGGDGSLSAPFIRFRGADGVVDDRAPEGRVEVQLRCSGNDEARDFSYIKKQDDGKAWLDLDPSSGKRGEEVDVRAYCPGNGRGRFEADGLVDIRLRFDGGRLTGETHVENGAPFGKTHGRLICENGARVSERFYVERDDHDRFIDIDPNHGKRGKEIDIRVHCDRDLKKLESDVLDDIDLDRDGDDWWKYHGTTHVTSDADYGEHTVRIKCGDDWLEDDFFVQREDSGDDDNDSGDQSGLYPVGGVETGGGPTEGLPLGALALGLTGVLGAGVAAAGGVLETRGVRR
jgi:hypothetical protein